MINWQLFFSVTAWHGYDMLASFKALILGVRCDAKHNYDVTVY